MKKLGGWIGFGIVGAMTGCYGEVRPPERPKSVPSSAVWAGGVDGGAWFECRVAQDRDANYCTIYDDNSGDVWAKGYFVLRGGGKAAKRDELVYDFFDGDEIYLKGGKILEPVKESPPAGSAGS